MAATAVSPLMAVTSSLPTFVLSIVVAFYVCGFVVFAILRVLTGISIQRPGYLSLKRISLELKNGVKLEVRTLGLVLHRPTFAQPTWVSVVVQGAQVTLDLRQKDDDAEEPDPAKLGGAPPEGARSRSRSSSTVEDKQKKALKLVRQLKSTLRRLHRWIRWLSMVDIVLTDTTITVADIGSLQIGMMNTMVDTRRKTADRNRMFDHCNELKREQQPAEWMFTLRSVLFFPNKKEPVELMDHCMFNIYGVLEKEIEGIKDLAISLKLGRISVPYDDLLGCAAKLKGFRKEQKGRAPRPKESNMSLSTVMEEITMPGSRTERMTEVVMEGKEIMQTFLKGVKEVQFAIGYLLVTKAIDQIQPSGKPLHMLFGMKELGIDIHRLDQESPAHKMYFAPGDIAHQALLAGIAISVSLDDGVRQDKILYVPMVTMTSRTTLLSKTIEIVEQSESNRNSNILFANVGMTSPSIDLEPRHLPVLVALFNSKSSRPAPGTQRAHLISRLLPKATVKLSIQEPVIRMALPPTGKNAKAGDIDMLISTASSISADLEASHEAGGGSKYSLDASFRITSQNLYYHAASGQRHDLLQIDSFDVKAQLDASPEVQVVAHAYLETFSVRLVRPEIVEGIKQTVGQFHKNVKPDKMPSPPARGESLNILRRVPLWLDRFKMEGRDFSVEVAGVDAEISEYTRGAALQVDTWSVDYKARKGEGKESDRPTPRRRAASRTINAEDLNSSPKKPAPRPKNPTDGRKLTLHLRGVEGYMVDSPETWEQDPFMALPHFDLSFATSSDREGPTAHINSHSKSFFFNYSLYRHYTVIVATKILREAFFSSATKTTPDDETWLQPLKSPNALGPPATFGGMDFAESPINAAPEFISMDFKLQQVQVKATMPEDPPLMIELHGLDAGRHRWGFPFLKVKNFRMYAESPSAKKCWARLISIRSLQLHLRDMKRESRGAITDEKSCDLTADAVRLAIPHQMILHTVTDNIINAAKACEQMHHRFKTGTNEYVLKKKAVGPKKVPRITVRTKALLLELEDDPFETELGLIYRLGLSEQKKRLAREAAFDAKVKKMRENEKSSPPQSPSTSLDQPAKTRGRSKTWRAELPKSRGLSPDAAKQKRRSRSAMPSSQKKASTGGMRYDPESASGPSENASVSIEEAWQKLLQHNSTAWIKRVKNAKVYYASRHREARDVFWGPDEMPFETGETEKILGLPLRPALMAGYFNDVDIVVDKPSFPLNELPRFLHRVGKGLPEDTQFALLVPLSIKLQFSEARVLLRDYPLPFIHVPNMRSTQPLSTPTWSLQTDFVIAEELRDDESMRHALIHIVPPTDGPGIRSGGFAIDVRRTVSPVKSYSDIKVSINTEYATRITWCTSYQPAIQDLMMVFETFSKPHVDPSEKTGFWDKIRLILHSEIALAWPGEGDVHFTLKGSRDPYKITGDGAGFVMCWRGDVKLTIGKSKDPQELVVVDSDQYILAIPDFAHHAIDDFESSPATDTKSVLSSSTYKSTALFKKVVMKLSGRVRWMVGLLFEQELSHEEDWKQRKRSFKFRPHYDITLKSPQYAKAPPGEVYDAFKGFRSDHLHLSLAIISPNGGDWSEVNNVDADSYNTIHLTPRTFTHFFSWWNLFSGVMSLPVRQGTLWPGPEKSTKKFGRHLATIKYKLCLSPLYLSHIYKHADQSEEDKPVVAATGLKGKLDTFLLDIHQRREEVLPNSNSTAMRINQAELDFYNADIRAVSAVIAGITMEDLMKQASDLPQSLGENIRVAGDMSQFTIPDGDTSWIDMDDFIELDWVLPSDRTPVSKIMPLAHTPRFTYFRQTDNDETWNPSPFGSEPHSCIMNQSNDPREIQCELVQARLEKVNHQMGKNKEAIDSLANHMKWRPDDADLKAKSEELIKQSSVLFNKLRFLQAMLRKMSTKLQDSKLNGNSEPEGRDSLDMDGFNGEAEMYEIDPHITDYASDYDNRFIVHNMQAKWNNQLRNIIMKYIHQVSQRRGFVYYMSRRAVRFILDIIEEQKSSGQPTNGSAEFTAQGPSSAPQDDNDDVTLQSRIDELLNDDKKFVIANEKPLGPHTLDEDAAKLGRDDLGSDVAQEYVPKNGYHVRLIAPQIQMQSEKNEGAAVLVAAQGMQLKVVSVMDRERIGDEVSGLVQRRFALNLDNTQFFVSHHKDFAQESMSLHSANRYGAPSGSSWPPWVPLETMFDFHNNPVGFHRVVERTSATLRYDKHNSLRLKYSDQVSGMERRGSTAASAITDVERRIDQIWVNFPRVEASCDSSQYFAVYIIVLDVLLYSEPLEKLRSEKLEKIMLASDFSDLTGAPEMVECLQSRIHQLEEIKNYFQVHAMHLDEDGWKSRLAVDDDLASCEEELFFIMKAITTAQRKHEDRGSQTSSVVRWYLSAGDIILHMLREQHDPLMDIMLSNAAYERVDNADASHFNTVEVEMMRGFNLLPNAAYPEIIAPFFDQQRTVAELRRVKILRVYWHMLEAIAGIPVMDHFEVNLFPLKIQLERDIAEKVFEYIFPGVGKTAFDDGGFSPFMVHSMKPLPDPVDGSDSDDDDDDAHSGKMRPMTPSIRRDDSSSTRSDEMLGIESRLHPTLSLSPDDRPNTSASHAARPKTSSGGSVFSSFSQLGGGGGLKAKASHDSLSLRSKRKSLDDSSRSFISVSTTGEKKKMNLFARRGSSAEKPGHEQKRSDELSQMMSRASNYMTLAYIKIPSVVLCLSYKGKKDSNLEDIHEFVFRMPMLEYRNKMWSNLDLAMHLKKDIIRALVSHTGAILQNKIMHHRPNKPQPNLFRMMANNGSLSTSAASGSSASVYDLPTLDGSQGDSSSSSQYSPRPGSSGSVLSRQTTSMSSLALPQYRRPQSSYSQQFRPQSSYSAMSETTLADYSPDGTSPEDDDDEKHGLFHNTLGRHLTNLAQAARHREGIAGDTEESIKKKSRMLLGKKVFSGL